MKTLTLKASECTLDLIHNSTGCYNGNCDTCSYMRYHLFDGNIKIATADNKGLKEMMKFISITR